MADETTPPTTTKSSGKTPTIPPPPRLTGDPQADNVALASWYQRIFEASQLQAQTIGNLTGDAGDFDPNSLPDPASSSVAQAQQTANEAYTLAAAAQGLVKSRCGPCGQVTISAGATTADFTFPADDQEADTSYFVSVTATAFGGTPAAGSREVITVAKTTSKVTITTAVAPGVGNSITFDVTIRR
jgi:hypothetical protein